MRTRGGATLGLVLAVCLVAAACNTANLTPQVGGRPTSPSSSKSAAHITISPPGATKNASPGRGIDVQATGGKLVSVSVQAQGDPVTGRFNAAHTAWHSRWALDVATRYSVRAKAIDSSGLIADASSSFRTLDPSPSRTFTTTIFQGYKQTYGVGMPIILQFNRPITNHRAVERSLVVRSSKPIVGAWYWDGDRTLYFRPRNYWPAGTTVQFTGHLNGVQGAPGVYGFHTLTQTFKIGESVIAVASTSKHYVKIYRDKKLFANWPISTGRPGDNTPNGTYLTIEKGNPVRMIGPGYNILVPWSVRFTWSGDYMHDAYWSVGEQGFENVSHGCVNMSPAHAETYYKMAVPGDPVTVTGSPRGGKWGNGWTVWFLSWHQLLAGTATHMAVKAGPDGSKFVSPSKIAPARAKAPTETAHAGNAQPG